MSRVSRLALVLAGALALASACGGGLERTTVTFAGGATFEVEVADSDEERRRGLMGRTELGERSGMLFAHDGDVDGGFWMKDTLLPLSIAFIDRDGRVVRLLDMEPCREDPCPVYRPGTAYRLALEVNLGAFERLGVSVGDVARVGE